MVSSWILLVPFVDPPDLGVPVQLLHRIILGDPHAAVHFDGLRRHLLGDLRTVILRHGRLRQERQPGVAQARGVVHQQARRLHFHRHLRQFELHALEFADGLAELLALAWRRPRRGPARRAPGRSSARRWRCALRSASRWRSCSPCPPRPSRSRAAPRQLSRISSQVDDARSPSLSSFLPTWKPGKSRSIRNAVMPLISGLRIGIGEQQEEARLRRRW